MLARSVLLLFAGLLLSGLAGAMLWLGAAAEAVALILLWLALASAIVWAVVKEARGDLIGSLALRPPRARALVIGIVIALVAGAALRAVSIGLDIAVHGEAEALAPLSLGPAAWAWLVGFAGPIVIAPIVEEAFFRGVVQTSLQGLIGGRIWPSRRAGVVGSVVVTAVAFAAVHLASAVDLGDLVTIGVSTLLVGLVCGALRAGTGTIVPSMVAHAAFNASAIVISVAAVGGRG